MSDGHTIGDRVRLICGATGRYIGSGKGLFVSSSTNDLGIDHVKPNGEPAHQSLPVPTDGEVEAAALGLAEGGAA